jgi:ribosome biogenesis protein BMS1
MEFDGDQKNKKHVSRTRGNKVNIAKDLKFKKEKLEGKHNFKDKEETLAQKKSRNPKAFAVNAPNKARTRTELRLNSLHKREHIPVQDRAETELPPPIIVAVHGPPGVGKSLLIKCLVKHFTQQSVNDLKGPITFVSAKKRRVTLIEVPNDLTGMIDVAKIADLVLLVVDAHYGYEMETFEFLNLLQSHGFPRVIGVLTHLDLFQKQHLLKKRKKNLKKRFWAEIFEGAKLFYMEGMRYGKYLKRDIVNLGRFISTQKFRPLLWRNTHPFILADRVEDVTNPELIRQDENCDRTVALFGYVHGTQLKQVCPLFSPLTSILNLTLFYTSSFYYYDILSKIALCVLFSFLIRLLKSIFQG